MSNDLVPYLPQERVRRRIFLLCSLMLLGGLIARVAFGPDPILVVLALALVAVILLPILNWWDYRHGVEMVSPTERLERRRLEQAPFWLAVVPQSLFYGAFMAIALSTQHPILDAAEIGILVTVSLAAALLMGLFRVVFEATRRAALGRQQEQDIEHGASRFDVIAHISIMYCLTFGLALAASVPFSNRFDAGLAYIAGATIGVLIANFVSPGQGVLEVRADRPMLGLIFRNIFIASSLLVLVAVGALFTFDPATTPIRYLEIAGFATLAACGISIFFWAMMRASLWTPGLRQRQ